MGGCLVLACMMIRVFLVELGFRRDHGSIVLFSPSRPRRNRDNFIPATATALYSWLLLSSGGPIARGSPPLRVASLVEWMVVSVFLVTHRRLSKISHASMASPFWRVMTSPLSIVMLDASSIACRVNQQAISWAMSFAEARV